MPIPLPANYTLPVNQIPQPIVGYTSGVNGLNQAVVIEVHDITTNKENVVLSVGGGAPRSIIANEFSQVSGSYPFYGQLTPNGQFAAIIPGMPNTPTDTIQYGNLAVPSTVAATIASEAPASGPIPNTALAVDPSEPSLPIISLQEGADDWYPDVNSNGAVAFPALLGPQGNFGRRCHRGDIALAVGRYQSATGSLLLGQHALPMTATPSTSTANKRSSMTSFGIHWAATTTI